jgi:hypothetical protein
MNERTAATVTALSAVLAAYFFIVGGVLSTDPPTPATDAVGNGLIAIGGALALTAGVVGCVYLEARQRRLHAQTADQPPTT